MYIICLINTTGPKGADYFAEVITWKLLKKQQYRGLALDINVSELQGVYTGAVRGSTHSLEVKSITNGITVQSVADANIDTLDVYIGNNVWMNGNDRITIENNEYHIDKAYNYYVLKRENN